MVKIGDNYHTFSPWPERTNNEVDNRQFCMYCGQRKNSELHLLAGVSSDYHTFKPGSYNERLCIRCGRERYTELHEIYNTIRDGLEVMSREDGFHMFRRWPADEAERRDKCMMCGLGFKTGSHYDSSGLMQDYIDRESLPITPLTSADIRSVIHEQEPKKKRTITLSTSRYLLLLLFNGVVSAIVALIVRPWFG